MNRAIRNNNPLNLRRTADRWQGMAKRQTDNEFVQFTSTAYGYRAAWKVLDSYFLRFRRERRPFTVRNIIARWAPPSENDTEAYIRAVVNISGLGGNESIPRPLRYKRFAELHTAARLLSAMTCVECGLPLGGVDTDALWQGYDLAFPSADRLKKLTEEAQARDEYWDWSPTA